jgi:hypothetical protein
MNDEVLPDQVALMCRLTYAALLATVAGAAITTLAHACNMQILDPASKVETHRRFLGIHGQKDAADYLEEVENRIRSRRRT